MPKDVYLQPHAPDPVLSEDAVLDLVQRHVPYARAVTGVDESGGEARTYLVDDDLVLKTQRPHRLRPRTSLKKEAAFLHHLAGYPTIPVPRLLGYGQTDDVEYLCLTRMPGDAVIRQKLAGAERTDVLRALGQVLRQIHAAPQAPLVASGLFPAIALPTISAAACPRHLTTRWHCSSVPTAPGASIAHHIRSCKPHWHHSLQPPPSSRCIPTRRPSTPSSIPQPTATAARSTSGMPTSATRRSICGDGTILWIARRFSAATWRQARWMRRLWPSGESHRSGRIWSRSRVCRSFVRQRTRTCGAYWTDASRCVPGKGVSCTHGCIC